MTSNHRTAASVTATRFMLQQAGRPAEFHTGRTAQQYVDDWVNDAVEQGKDGQAIGAHAVKPMHAVRYLIASGGPFLDVTFVFTYPRDDDDPDNDPDGDNPIDNPIDYAIVEYSEGGPRAHRVLTGWAANRLHRALRDGDSEQDTDRDADRDTAQVAGGGSALAKDAQPGVMDINQLDPQLWIGAGAYVTAAESGPELVADNTIRAGWALFAVKAFHHRLTTAKLMEGLRDPARLVPQTQRQWEPARDAVAAFAQLTMPTAGPGDLPTAVQYLLTDLYHLSSAKAHSRDESSGAPDHSPTALDPLIDTLTGQLQNASPAWAQGLSDDPSGPYDPHHLGDPEKMRQIAYRRCHEEATGLLD
jgi:hypothetical protein